MFTVAVFTNTFRKVEVARYRFATRQEAKSAQLDIMTEWRRKLNFGIVVTAVMSPR